MNTMEAILARRSIRKYKDEPVADEQLRVVCAAGLAAASGRGIRPVEFVVVRDKAVLASLSKSRAMGAGMLKKADVCIVVVANEDKSDTWVEDSSIAMSNMMLAATELGLGCCWVQGRMRQAADGATTEDTVRNLLGIPQELRLEAMLALGIPDEEKPAYEIDSLEWSKVHTGAW